MMPVATASKSGTTANADAMIRVLVSMAALPCSRMAPKTPAVRTEYSAPRTTSSRWRRRHLSGADGYIDLSREPLIFLLEFLDQVLVQQHQCRSLDRIILQVYKNKEGVGTTARGGWPARLASVRKRGRLRRRAARRFRYQPAGSGPGFRFRSRRGRGSGGPGCAGCGRQSHACDPPPQKFRSCRRGPRAHPSLTSGGDAPSSPRSE